MIDTGITIKLYELSELSEKAKAKAIDEHRCFLLSVMQPDDFISGDPQYDTPEELGKAYELEQKYLSDYDEPVIESIEANEYLYFESGEMAHTVTYVKSGETHLHLNGVDYLIKCA